VEDSKRHAVSHMIVVPLARPWLGYAQLITDPRKWKCGLLRGKNAHQKLGGV